MCYLCEIKPVYEFTNKRKLCRICFIKYFEKKFLYILRKFNMTSRGDVIYFKKSENFRDIALNYLLDNFKDKIMIPISKKGYSKIALSSSIDSISEEIIRILIKRNTKDLDSLLPVFKKGSKKEEIIRPLYLFLDKEITLYCKIKKLKFKSSETKSKFLEFLNSLEKKHPEVKRAVIQSYLDLYNLR